MGGTGGQLHERSQPMLARKWSQPVQSVFNVTDVNLVNLMCSHNKLTVTHQAYRIIMSVTTLNELHKYVRSLSSTTLTANHERSKYLMSCAVPMMPEYILFTFL